MRAIRIQWRASSSVSACQGSASSTGGSTTTQTVGIVREGHEMQDCECASAWEKCRAMGMVF